MNVIVLYVMNADRSTIGAQTPSAQVLMDGQLMSKEPQLIWINTECSPNTLVFRIVECMGLQWVAYFATLCSGTEPGSESDADGVGYQADDREDSCHLEESVSE